MPVESQKSYPFQVCCLLHAADPHVAAIRRQASCCLWWRKTANEERWGKLQAEVSIKISCLHLPLARIYTLEVLCLHMKPLCQASTARLTILTPNSRSSEQGMLDSSSFCLHRREPLLIWHNRKAAQKDSSSVQVTCRSRKENLENARNFAAAGNATAAYECYQRAVDISPAVAKQFIEVRPLFRHSSVSFHA